LLLWGRDRCHNLHQCRCQCQCWCGCGRKLHCRGNEHSLDIALLGGGRVPKIQGPSLILCEAVWCFE
jgi:hypothetical protein